MIQLGKSCHNLLFILLLVCNLISCTTKKSCQSMIASMLNGDVTMEQLSTSTNIPGASLAKMMNGEHVSSVDSLSILNVYQYYKKNKNIRMLSKAPYFSNSIHTKNEYINRELQQHSAFVKELKNELKDSLHNQADRFILCEFKLKGGLAIFKELLNREKWKKQINQKIEYYFTPADIDAFINSKLAAYYGELSGQRRANMGITTTNIPDIASNKFCMEVTADRMYINFSYTVLKCIDDVQSIIFYPFEWLLNLLPWYILILVMLGSVVNLCLSRNIWAWILFIVPMICLLVPDPNEKIKDNLYYQIDKQLESIDAIEQQLIVDTNKYYGKQNL